MTDTALEVEGLGKRYRIGATRAVPYRTLRESLAAGLAGLLRRDRGGRDLWALHDVTFTVERGTVVGIIGRNGAGKTTLLKLLSRITEPTTGRARLFGRVGSLLEVGTGFHPELTGRENVYLNGAILGLRRAEIRRRFDEIVEFAEIAKFLDTPVKRYSSGMYMRLAFSVAAHLDTEILLIDEVLAVGDAAFQAKCLTKIGEIGSAGRTVLFVSHNMGAVQRFCRTAHLLDGGTIVRSGDVGAVVAEYYRSLAAARDTATAAREVHGDMGFVGWSVASGPGTHAIFSGEACDLRFALKVRQPVRQAYFGIAIYGSDDGLLWSMRSKDSEHGYSDLAPGTHEVGFRLPSLPARPGEYRIRVSANTVGTQHDDWYAEPLLQVLPLNESGLPPHWQGILNLPGTFSISTHDE